ncbi:MAG: biotin--[acetyl-CoA-carboxylase] ligase [Saprospiraceae bacterium]|nr:biotin--[acetyl-CoA-carboxylase] ligase [Saprospiraceae bacterium]
MNIPEPLFTGKIIIHLTDTASTNDYAMELISKTNPSEGTCIRADYQTGGRGQIGRYWHSESEKNLLISYIFYPAHLKAEDQFILNIISGLAVLDLVAEFLPGVKIKWPNDIYVNNKKIAGILVQNTLRESFIKSTVIGVGLNVNQMVFPNEIHNPTSIFKELSTLTSIETLLPVLSSKLEYYYLLLKKGNTGLLTKLYLSNLYQINEWAAYKDTEGNLFNGKITSIDDHGKLEMILHSGAIRVFGFREISFVI